MALFEVTAPTAEPLTLADAKTHLRVDEDVHDEDGLIQSLIGAARQHVEAFTHRAVPSQTWDEKFDGFPCGELWLSKPPVSSVTSVTYLDYAGVSQTWATSNYITDLPTGPHARRARVYPAYGVSWPQTYSMPNAVTVRFVAGYAAAAVPGPILAAMKLLIGHWYEHREAVIVGTISQELPMAVPALLWPFKAF